MATSTFKRFLTGSLRNFVILLLAFSGIKAWQSGQLVLAVVLIVALLGLLFWQYKQWQQRNASNTDHE